MRPLRAGRLMLCAGTLVALVPGTAYATSSASDTTLVSVALDGRPSQEGASGEASISADGRYVAFMSTSPDLVAGDTNGVDDVFVRDRQAGVTTRVNVDSAGGQAGGVTDTPSISGDGRYVAFMSDAANLVPGDTNGRADVFVHDLATGTTSRVSVGSSGEQADGHSFDPAISADGQFVAYDSYASNLVSGDTNKSADVFEYSVRTGETVRVSVNSNGIEGNGRSDRPTISADGGSVAFESEASNLTPPDTNRLMDIFVHDRSGRTERVSVSALGAQADSGSRFAMISADGRHVVYQSYASNLVPGDTNGNCDNFLVDRQTSTVTRLNLDVRGEQNPRGTGQGVQPSVSGDGRFVAFETGENNLVPDDYNGVWDVFVRDRDTATTTRASVAGDGSEANGRSARPSISADGKHVAFESAATNLAPGTIRWHSNVYVRDLAG